MRNRFFTNINATGISATQHGAAVPAQQAWLATIQAISTGGLTGSVLLEASNDQPATLQVDSSGNFLPVNWNTVASLTISGSGTALMAAQELVCTFMRSSFTYSTGTGDITTNFVVHDSHGV